MQLSVFDLDHTLLSVNGSYQFGSYLYKQGIISFASMGYCVYSYALHKLGLLSVRQLHKKTFNRLFKGMDLDDLEKRVGLFLDLHLSSMLYLPAIEKLRSAQQQGHCLAILSSSPDYIVKPIAARLGVIYWESTRFAVDEKNQLCAISSVMQGKDKAASLLRLADQLNIPKEAVHVYTDSYLDFPLLEVAGNIIGVNPDRKLRSLCVQKGWTII